MKIYFYGATLAAAEKKGTAFANSLKKKGEKLIGKDINVTRINNPAEADMNCVIMAYKYSVLVEYSIMKSV